MVYYFNFVYPASMKTDCLSWTAPATPRFGKLKKTRSSENGILSPCFPQHKACFSVMSGSTPNQLALHIPIFFWWRVLAIGNCWALHLRFPIWAGVLHLQTCSFRLGPTGKGSGKHQRWAISATESIHQQKWTFHTRIQIGMSLYHENLWAEPARSSSWISGSWWSNQRTCILWWL